LKKKGETVRNRRPGFNQDLVHLEFAIRRNENVRLVVIDSLPGLCPDKKTYRQTLRQLEEIARRRNVAIVATARPSTRSRGRPKVEGDKLSEEVRCLFHVLCDPEDPQSRAKQRRFLAPVRMNFCEEPEWLAFRIDGGVLVWETPTDGPPLSNCLASPTRQKAVRLHEAMDWLREALQDEDQPAAVMNRQARALGYADSTVRRACERLEVRHIRCEFGPVGLWMWALPELDEEPDEKAVSSPDATPPYEGGEALAVSRARPYEGGEGPAARRASHHEWGEPPATSGTRPYERGEPAAATGRRKGRTAGGKCPSPVCRSSPTDSAPTPDGASCLPTCWLAWGVRSGNRRPADRGSRGEDGGWIFARDEYLWRNHGKNAEWVKRSETHFGA
jgi:hypothetical protein